VSPFLPLYPPDGGQQVDSSPLGWWPGVWLAKVGDFARHARPLRASRAEQECICDDSQLAPKPTGIKGFWPIAALSLAGSISVSHGAVYDGRGRTEAPAGEGARPWSAWHSSGT
jgi:hypothetical protein